MGLREGDFEGFLEGDFEGVLLGDFEGFFDGLLDGDLEGFLEGDLDGLELVGDFEGFLEGVFDGFLEGDFDGLDEVGEVGGFRHARAQDREDGGARGGSICQHPFLSATAGYSPEIDGSRHAPRANHILFLYGDQRPCVGRARPRQAKRRRGRAVVIGYFLGQFRPVHARSVEISYFRSRSRSQG